MTIAALVLASLLAQDGDPVEKTRHVTAEYHDSARGIDFRIKPDGSVTLKATDPDKEGIEKTWKAKSPEQFRAKYPEIVEEYNLEPLLAPQEPPSFDVEDLDRTMRESLKEFTDAWRREEGRAQDGKPRIGLLVTRVPAALTSQLKLKEGEGVLVIDVYEDSLASKAGLKRHDIVLELDGKPVKEIAQFTADVKPLLEKESFKLTILREGKKETIEVRPERPKKSE